MTDRSRPDSALNGPNRQFTSRSLAKFLALCPFFSPLAVALSEKTLGDTLWRSTQQSTQAPRDAGSKADDEKDARLLEPGKPIKRELAGDHSHIYQIRLSAGQFLNVIIREKALGPEHPDVVVSLNNLANLYHHEKGDHANAERFHERALNIREKALGPEHPDVAQSLNNLAIVHHDRGGYVKAESLIQRALAIWEKALGPEHPDVAGCIGSLAVLYRDKGEYAKAESLFQRALAIWEKTLGPEHPDVVRFLDNLAILYAAKGAIAQAVTVQSRANSVSERNLALNLATGSERQKLAYLAVFSEQTDFTLSLHSQTAPHDPQALNLAFTTLLRRKGRGLDVMANTIGALRRHAAPEDQTLFDQLAEARSQLAALTLKESGTDKPETYRARLKSLEDKVEELESALSARRPEFRAQMQPVTLAAVQAALPAGGALVEFAVYTPRDPRNNKNKAPRNGAQPTAETRPTNLRASQREEVWRVGAAGCPAGRDYSDRPPRLCATRGWQIRDGARGCAYSE